MANKKDHPLDNFLKDKEDSKYVTGVEDIQGRRVTGASKSIQLRDYVTREEILDLVKQLNALGIPVTF